MHAWYATGAFSPWAADFNESLASDPFAWMRPDGQAEVFGVDAHGNLVKSLHSSAVWTSWSTLAESVDPCTSLPAPTEVDAGVKPVDAGPDQSSGPPGFTTSPSSSGGGCGCRAARSEEGGGSLAGAMAIGAALSEARRRRRRRSASAHA